MEQATGSAERGCLFLQQLLLELAPLDLVTDRFFLAGQLGPGRFQTRSWSFRSKNKLAFIKKQSMPVLRWPPSAGLAGKKTRRQPQPLRHPRLQAARRCGYSWDKSALSIQHTPLQPPSDLRIILTLWTHQALLSDQAG